MGSRLAGLWSPALELELISQMSDALAADGDRRCESTTKAVSGSCELTATGRRALQVRAPKAAEETDQHPPDFDDVVLLGDHLAPRDDRRVGGKVQVVFHFGRRADRDLHELREVPIGRAAAPLSEVRRNGQCRSAELPDEAGVVPPGMRCVSRWTLSATACAFRHTVSRR